MFTSALSVLLAVLFVLFIIAAAVDKGMKGQVAAPALYPELGTVEGVLAVFTVIPVMTNAFICHYNGEWRLKGVGFGVWGFGVLGFKGGMGGAVHPIYEELLNPTEGRMRIVSRYSQVR